MAAFTRTDFRCCFRNWMVQQQQELDELERALSDPRPEELERLRRTAIQSFEHYASRRAAMMQHDPPTFMAPPWCSSLENSNLWGGGCRPTVAVQLVLTVRRSEVSLHRDGLASGARTQPALATLGSHQIDLIEDLHLRTLDEEEAITGRMDTLQADIAEAPLALIARHSWRAGDWSEELERALEEHCRAMAELMAECDQLRVATMKEIIDILTPLQAVEFLASSKKLHLSMHEWGKTRDVFLETPQNG